MLRQFDDMLAKADRVVVVGYSFRDEHINVALTRWINSPPRRTLIVIDPNFNEDPRQKSRDSYPNELIGATEVWSSDSSKERRLLDLEVIREFAGVGLAQVFSAESKLVDGTPGPPRRPPSYPSGQRVVPSRSRCLSRAGPRNVSR